MSDGLANGTAGRKEEEVDVRVYLGYYTEIYVEMEV